MRLAWEGKRGLLRDAPFGRSGLSWLTSRIGPVVHFIMQRKPLLDIKRRAESAAADTLVSADRSLAAVKDAA